MLEAGVGDAGLWDEDEDDEVVAVVVCREIPGDHVGGPECWCVPYVLTSDEQFQHFNEVLADRPERQVN